MMSILLNMCLQGILKLKVLFLDDSFSFVDLPELSSQFRNLLKKSLISLLDLVITDDNFVAFHFDLGQNKHVLGED